MMKIKTIGAMGLAVAMVGSAFAWSHSPSSQSFGTSGGSFTLAVSGSENYDWNAGSSESWITVSRLSATTFSVSVAANTGSDERRGNVTINAFQSDSTHSAQTWVSMQSCGITQAGTGSGSGGGTSGGDTPTELVVHDVSPTSIIIGDSASVTSVVVSAEGSWSVENPLDWVTVDRADGTGNGAVVLTVSKNTGDTGRSGLLTIAGKTVALYQECRINPCGVANVTARQRYPYNGKIDIDYEVQGDLRKSAQDAGLQVSLEVKAEDLQTGEQYVASELTGELALTEGKHSVVWDMDKQGLSLKSEQVVFSVSCITNAPLYCIIDLSAGIGAESYPVTYANEIPNGTWSDVYRTTKLALRRIEPGSFTFQGNTITLTKPYYVSVFEMTDAQWSRIAGDTISNGTTPVGLWYVSIRGSDRGTKWPQSSDIDPESLLGKLQARTNVKFDLLTFAQWAYAYIAKTPDPYYWGSDYAWCNPYSLDTYKVGQLLPNNWGLYDMAGNVAEWVLDLWCNETVQKAIYRGFDPVGNDCEIITDKYGRDMRYRIIMGGCTIDDWLESPFGGFVSEYAWNYQDSDRGKYRGVRLSLTMSQSSMGLDRSSEETDVVAVNTIETTHAPVLTFAMTPDSAIVSTSWENDWPIHYTCDGSVPTATSMLYVDPIELFAKGAKTIKAIAISPEGEASEVATLEIPAAPTPTIEPADRTIISGKSVSVNISCSNSDATIYYTTDGSEPTTASSTYKRFKASTKMTVKAIAVVKDMAWSETATASYAFGTCADPVISPTDGTVFDHSNLSVSINWDSSTDGTLRYTTDGSEPTAASPAYTQPFAISETTTVKAKVFSDTYFDSAVVSATLTRVWNKVATPVISAPGVFSGSGAEVSITCATDGASIYYTTDGSEPNSHSKKYTAPFSVTATTRIRAIAIKSDWTKSDIADVTTSKEWSIGDSLGDSDRTFSTDATTGWVRDQTASKDGHESMRSGAIGNSSGGYVESTISTVVSGKGTVSFWWKASCEEDEDYEWDHAEFRVNGEVVDGIMINGITDWRQVTYKITTDGEHTLTWAFLKDDYDSEGEDCIWLDGVTWTAAEPQAPNHVTIPENVTGGKAVEIPLSWAQQFPGFTEKFGSDMAEAMLQPTKKRDGAGNELQVWHDYVAGTDPTDSNDVFRVTISIEDGVPVLSWQPDLNTNAIERTYQTYGRSTLSDETPWETPADTSRHHFFKVTVGMP